MASLTGIHWCDRIITLRATSTSPAEWRKPIKWNDQAEDAQTRMRVFCASLADVFEDRPDVATWRRDLFQLIERCQNLDWLLLTKRPDSAAKLLPKQLTRNVWLGVSVRNAETFDLDEKAVELKSRVGKVFLSIEPIVDRVRRMSTAWHEIDWAIVGGESGPRARLSHLDHIQEVIDLCFTYEKPVFVKQLGSRPAISYYDDDAFREKALDLTHTVWQYVGNPYGRVNQYVEWDHQKFGQPHPQSVIELRLEDPMGGNPDEWPRQFQVRQFPV